MGPGTVLDELKVVILDQASSHETEEIFRNQVQKAVRDAMLASKRVIYFYISMSMIA